MNNSTNIIVTKPSASETLKAIPVGESVTIKNREIRLTNLRSQASRLKSKGYLFETSEEGLVDEVKVTRLK